MRFRTKFFATSSIVVLLLWGGTLWPIQHTIASNFDRMADDNFSGTRQGLHSLQIEHVQRMRQVGEMVMEIPELRALIAEHNYELSSENLESLTERLDNLSKVTEVQFVCVLDGRGVLVAQNTSSPWPKLSDLHQFIAGSEQARPLVQRLFAAAKHPDQVQYGLWLYHNQLFQVVGTPMVFSGDPDSGGRPDGALIMGSPITNELADDLGASHRCEISFLAGDGMIATSLPGKLQTDLLLAYSHNHWPSSQLFDVSLGNAKYRSYAEPLVDPCSGTVLGTTIIQSSVANEGLLQEKISRSLLRIMTAGLLAAALASFLLSGAITRPVKDLVAAVKRVSAGDLNSSIHATRGDELGELALAFNEMVEQLRARRELERLVEQSQAASKAKSQFLANMSHEIRTPLHGVIGMATLLLGTELNERQRHYAQMVRSSTQVLTTLINDILDFSKIEAGKLELEAVDFELPLVVEDVVELLSQKASGKGVEMACHIAGNVPDIIRGDSNRLRQILMNLVGNSVKFTEAGEIIVRVSRKDSSDGKMLLHFEVSDTGIGISPEGAERLFKSFSQVDASMTRRYGGTGLGLAICKQLAELMGGAIGVESEVGKGSRFWFTVNVAAIDAPAPAPVPGLSVTTVLVAEPNRAIAGIIQDQLRDVGINAVTAFSADEIARRLVAGQSEKGFAVVLINQQMPGVDARQLGRAAVERWGVAPAFILLAGAATELKEQALRDAGFVRCIVKPVRSRNLLAAVAAAAGIKTTQFDAPTSPADAAIGPIHPTRRFRVLVAEDNEVNQIVAADFLAKHGCDSRVVGDGKSAVIAELENRYDLILMDCQMPIMDGFEATQAIRKHELEQAAKGHPSRRVPIVALTANASGADRARCMEAGMQAYCEKPFRTHDLIRTLRELLADNNGETAREASAAIAVTMTPAVSVAAVAPTAPVVPAALLAPASPVAMESPINVESLLEQCSGNTALALTILEKFEKQAGGIIAELEKNLADNNLAQAARASHTLKGTAGIISARDLRQVLADMEDAGRASEISRAEAILARVREEIDRCGTALPEVRSKLKGQSIVS